MKLFVTRLIACLVGSLAAVALAGDYPSPENVNLLRHTDTGGTADVAAEFTGISSGGGVAYPAFYAVDSGYYCAQVTFSSKSETNTASIRITLPAAVAIGQIEQQFVWHRPSQYRVRGSLSGFTEMTELAPWTALSGYSATVTVNTAVRYLSFDYLGTQDSQYLLIKELIARPPSGAQIDVLGGYNLMALRPAEGGPGPVPGDSLYRQGWLDSPANITDLNVDTYLRGAGSQEPFFVLPLNGSYLLSGFALGAYHGQGWNGITVEVTAAAAIDGSTSWRQVYTQSGFTSSCYRAFAAPVRTRFVRVSTPLSGSTGAMCEFSLFAVPDAEALAMLKPVPGSTGGGVTHDFWVSRFESRVAGYVDFLNAVDAAAGLTVVDGQVKRATGGEVYCLTQAAEAGACVAYDAQAAAGARFSAATDRDEHPMVFVSWFGAAAYGNWKSGESGLTPVYDPANGWIANALADGYRLPTEAEWRKAAAWDPATGLFRVYGTGADTLGAEDANYLNSGDAAETEEVRTLACGSYSTLSPTGISDASGNVWEWCQDLFESGGEFDTDPHAVRGGSWGNLKTDLTAASRSGFKPSQALSTVGFRIVTTTQIAH